jgi:hypothetical protein
LLQCLQVRSFEDSEAGSGARFEPSNDGEFATATYRREVSSARRPCTRADRKRIRDNGMNRVGGLIFQPCEAVGIEEFAFPYEELFKRKSFAGGLGS